MSQGQDLWLHNRVKTLEEASSSAPAGSNPGQLDTLLAIVSRYEQNSPLSYTNSNIDGTNLQSLCFLAFSAVNLYQSGYDNRSPSYNRFKEPYVIQSCNVTSYGSDHVIYDRNYSTGYSSSNHYSYPAHGIRAWAIENTSTSTQTANIYFYYSGYSSYSGVSMYAVTPSGSLTNGKYTSTNSTALFGTSAGTSTNNNINYTFPASTVTLFFLITSDRYITSNSNNYIFHHMNGLYDLRNVFTNTNLKPRNDFIAELAKQGTVDADQNPDRAPQNLWNKLVLNQSMTIPTAYSHLT